MTMNNDLNRKSRPSLEKKLKKLILVVEYRIYMYVCTFNCLMLFNMPTDLKSTRLLKKVQMHTVDALFFLFREWR